MKYKVLVTTSGPNQRMGNLTKYTNKALIRLGMKPAISYIIDSYPQEVEFVITLGYFGDQVRDFLELTYPKRNFKFVRIPKNEGGGTSLGYSMLKAKQQLQCPFIYHASDTVVKEPIPAPNINWNGGAKGENATLYASFESNKDSVGQINDKAAKEFDYLHIGLVGIKDYEAFWKTLENLHNANSEDSHLNDSKVINLLLSRGISFKLKEFKTWIDIGDVENLEVLRDKIGDNFENLDKSDQSIFIFDDFVVKFFYNEKIIDGLLKRAKNLGNLIPKIEGRKGKFFRYKKAQGSLYSKVVTINDFRNFLSWCKINLWKDSDEVTESKFREILLSVYIEKTSQRVKQFLVSHSILDNEEIINGEKVPKIEELLSKIDPDLLCKTRQSTFHGDLILDNIIKTKESYILLDWRADFEGLYKSGDIYYDLAKINHSLIVNHEIVSKNKFKIYKSGNKIECSIERKKVLEDCQKVYFEFLKESKFDTMKVKLMTSLVWLNSSPLHHYPYSLFLYYFGKLNFYKELKSV